MALTEHEPIEDGAPSPAVESEIEELRRRAKELEKERDAALNLADTRARWLAHVSHELRTPMNGILGMTRLALDTELSSEQREHLDLVRRSADSLMTLINDTLDHARITSGKLAFERIPFNLRDAIELATRTMEPSATEKGISLRLDMDAKLPPRIVGDPGRLRQVIFNLVGNAIKFTKRGGVVVRIRQHACVAGECLVHFSVSDTGVGIEPDRLAAIFEPFEQAAAGTRREYGGTGLGLAISRQLVAGMGGSLQVSSDVDRGTEFEFTLPFQVDEAPVRLGAGGSLAGVRALVISDNPINRRTLVEMLDAERMAGMVVENPLEARLYLRKARAASRGFDLLVLDLERDGLELAAGLLEDAGEARTVFLTPSGQRGDAARCREMGIDAYLTGPIEVDDMVMAIRAVREGAATLVTRHWLRERRRPLSILLADDSETNRDIAVRLLQRAGHRVTAVGDGNQAVASYRAGTFDAVILDVEMPVKDGPAAAREIRELASEDAAVPIIALTGHIADDDRARFLAAGMDAVVAKPFQLHDVLAVLDRLTRNRATSTR